MNSPHHISSFTTNRIFTAFKLNQRGWPISPLRMPDSLPWVFFAATIFGVNHCISESALCKLHNLILGLKRRGGIHTKETRSERDTCTPMFIAALFIITRTWKQPRCPSADKWIRKLSYIYTTGYYSAIKKNSFESVLMRWMKLEPIIQSEVSQKDKDQYSIIMYIYGI